MPSPARLAAPTLRATRSRAAIAMLLALLVGMISSGGRTAHAAASQVQDIYSGSESSNPSHLTNVNGTLFFAAEDYSSGIELWKSDGTDAGTVQVKDINPGDYGSEPDMLTNVNGTLFFAAYDESSGTELWKSDGTAAGTVRVKDINPGSENSSPNYLTNVNGTLFFAADDGSSGRELWKSDGTAAGTVRVKDINPGEDGSAPNTLTDINGTLFFAADDGRSGDELWKSNGTAAGTVQVKDINPGMDTSDSNYLTNVNGTLFFQATDGSSGYELWKSNGTAAGTVRVKDIHLGSDDSSPDDLTNVNGTLFFRADDGSSGTELWKSDGTSAGTVRVKDINPDGDSFNSFNENGLTNVNGTLFFAVDDGDGTALWKSDGTSAGTVLVYAHDDDAVSYYQYDLTNVNGTLFFAVRNNEVWKSNGTSGGTVPVQLINPDGDASVSDLTSVNGRLFFTADDGSSGIELWSLLPSTLGIDVFGYGVPIAMGETSPNDANGTDFGQVPPGDSWTQTFTIANTGAAPMSLSGTPPVTISGAGASDFRVTQQPASTLAVGTRTTFDVTFTPPLSATRSALISIAVGGSPTPYSFAIQGIGINTAPFVFATNFDVGADAPNGTFVGEVSAADEEDNIKLSGGYALTAGNTGGAFAIDDSGTLTVARASRVVPGSTFTITVQVTDRSGLVGTGTITITVSKADQTLTFAPLGDRTYGDAPFTPGAVASSRLPVSFSSLTDEVCTVGGSTVTLVAAGTCTIAAQQPGDTMYNHVVAASSFTVTKKLLTVTVADVLRKVGTANPPLPVFYTGFVKGENAGVFDTPPTASTSANESSLVGTYPITISGGVATNYRFAYVPGTLTVTDKSIPLLAWGEQPAITYGTPLSATQLNAAASVDGQPLAGTFTYDPPLGTVLNAGAGQVLKVTFVPSDTALYASLTKQVQLDVTPAPLTITAEDQTMAAGAALPTLTVRYSGFVNGDTAAALDTPVLLITSATTSSVAGVYDIVPSGAQDANYLITFVNGKLTIGIAAPALRATQGDRGRPGSFFTFAVQGFPADEVVQITVNGRRVLALTAQANGTGAFVLYFAPSAPPGTYTITATAPLLTAQRATADVQAQTQVMLDIAAPLLTLPSGSTLPQASALPITYLPLITR